MKKTKIFTIIIGIIVTITGLMVIDCNNEEENISNKTIIGEPFNPVWNEGLKENYNIVFDGENNTSGVEIVVSAILEDIEEKDATITYLWKKQDDDGNFIVLKKDENIISNTEIMYNTKEKGLYQVVAVNDKHPSKKSEPFIITVREGEKTPIFNNKVREKDIYELTTDEKTQEICAKVTLNATINNSSDDTTIKYQVDKLDEDSKEYTVIDVEENVIQDMDKDIFLSQTGKYKISAINSNDDKKISLPYLITVINETFAPIFNPDTPTTYTLTYDEYEKTDGVEIKVTATLQDLNNEKALINYKWYKENDNGEQELLQEDKEIESGNEVKLLVTQKSVYKIIAQDAQNLKKETEPLEIIVN